MSEEIIKILKSKSKALDIYELAEYLSLNSSEEYKELIEELNKMEEDSLIHHTNKDKYMILEDSHIKSGVMRVNKKGFGFVDVDNLDDDVYIDETNLNGAIHNDRVLCEVTSKLGSPRLEGRILKIVKRESNKYVGEITYTNDIGTIKLDDDKVKLNITVKKEDGLNSVDGHKVVVELGKQTDKYDYMGKVIEILGHKNDPGVDILSVVKKYNIDTEFGDQVKEEVKNIPSKVEEKDIKNRKDLREEMIFTIDGDDTKDIDDAISIKKNNDGYELGVHIADVSYYVKENSPLDQEAMERGTSVYLVDRVIPMIPHELSNGICSLNPNVDRLAISCVMQYDTEGNLKDYDIFESVIKSRIQMTYKKVNQLLEENVVVEGYSEYEESLRLMKEFSDILRKKMVERGYIDFDIDEAKILVDESGVPTDIVKRYRGVGENLIENFMIAANECVATHIYNMELPFVYRVHEIPKEEKIREFISFLQPFGINIEGNLKTEDPHTIQKIVKAIKGREDLEILTALLLRKMQKAVYKPINLGHYGLGSKCYTHFTSPIRRYPDTTVHRLLRTYLFDKKIDQNIISNIEGRLAFITEHSSERERAAESCEREVDDMKMAEYMENHIGEEYNGIISSVMSFGMFIELDNLIEGLVPINDMDDFYHYDDEHLTLVGERTNKKYSIGDRVKVKVVRASKEDKQIDFEIIGKGDKNGEKEKV